MPELEPITRREKYLNALSEETQEIPEPVTREEMFLKKAIESSGGGSSLPEVTSSDNGKALGVVEGEWGKMDIPTELPTVTSSDEGKVLTVDSNGAWGVDNPSGGLPEVTSSDEGKVLTVDSNGAWGAEDNLYAVFYAYEIGGGGGRSIYFENGITEADIYNASITNKVVFIKSRDGQNATDYSNTYISTRKSSNTNYIFSATNSDRSNEIKYRFFIVNKNGQNTSVAFFTNTTSLPNVDATYNGRVLTVVNGVWNQAKVPSELPTVTSSDEGKVLTVDSNGAWGVDNPSGGLPEVTSSDNGKILSVVNGTWEKTSPNEGITKIICNRNEYNTYTIENNLTTTDIINYIENGKNVELLLEQSGNYEIYYLMGKDAGTNIYNFFSHYIFSGNIWATYFEIQKNNSKTISVSVKQITS